MNNDVKAYLCYSLKRNRRILIMISALLFLAIPFYVYMAGTTPNPLAYSNEPFTAFSKLIEQSVSCGFVIACIAPIFQFRFLYEKRMNDVYFSLPIKRSRLFYYQYFGGLITWFVPWIINVMLGYLVAFATRKLPTFEGATIIILLILLIVVVIQYTVVTYFSIKCNHVLDAIFVNGIYLVLPVVLMSGIAIFLSNQITELIGLASNDQYAFQNIINLCLSLPAYFYQSILSSIEIIIAPTPMDNIYGFALPMKAIVILIYWIVVSVIVFYLSKKNFVARKAEHCEQQTTAKITYPFIIKFTTLLMIIVILNKKQSQPAFTMIAIFAMYCGILFFSQRKIKLKLKDLLIFVGVCCFAYGIGWGFQITNGFGLIQRYPASENVEEASCYMYGNLKGVYGEDYDEDDPMLGNFYTEKQEDISKIIELNKKLKHTDEDNVDQPYTTVNFSYDTKNGNTLTRYYTVELNEEETSLLRDFIKNSHIMK